MRKYIILLIFLLPRNVMAGGFPVVDITSVTQQVTSYALQLQEHAQLLNQLGVMDKQYMQQLIDYAQTLQEYQIYLEQVAGLEKVIQHADWQKLMEQTIAYYGQTGDFATIPSLRVTSPHFSQDLDAVLRSIHFLPRNPQTLAQEASSLGLLDTNLFEVQNKQIFNQYDRFKNLQEQIAINAEESEKRKQAIEQSKMLVSQLSDASDLQTLQLMATQNQMMLNQNEECIRLMNQQMMKPSGLAVEMASKQAQAIDAEIRRLQHTTSSRNALWGKESWMQ